MAGRDRMVGGRRRTGRARADWSVLNRLRGKAAGNTSCGNEGARRSHFLYDERRRCVRRDRSSVHCVLSPRVQLAARRRGRARAAERIATRRSADADRLRRSRRRPHARAPFARRSRRTGRRWRTGYARTETVRQRMGGRGAIVTRRWLRLWDTGVRRRPMVSPQPGPLCGDESSVLRGRVRAARRRPSLPITDCRRTVAPLPGRPPNGRNVERDTAPGKRGSISFLRSEISDGIEVHGPLRTENPRLVSWPENRRSRPDLVHHTGLISSTIPANGRTHAFTDGPERASRLRTFRRPVVLHEWWVGERGQPLRW